uniref:GMP reductase n=1 Tax=Triatoma infestans TaxID=30076 RepID=A0A023F8B8_TRIIF
MPKITEDVKLDFRDVLVCPKRSTLKSRAEVDLTAEFKFKHSGKIYKGVPIIASNMDTIGTFEMARVLCKLGMLTAIHKFYTLDEWQNFADQYPDTLARVTATCGCADGDFTKLCTILDRIKEIQFITLDVANGYTSQFLEFVTKVRKSYPDHVIIAGNVATPEVTEDLILAGADLIKVGIGPGSVCTTRIKTGVGYPQLSAVLECADAAHSIGGHIISDGGCTCPGDVVKALAAGADLVMTGAMLAGHDECGGETVVKSDGSKVKLFYGMASQTAMMKRYNGLADYRCTEGKTVEVPYRGPVYNTALDLLGGIRSACTYVGCAGVAELPEKTTFVRCQQQANYVYGNKH